MLVLSRKLTEKIIIADNIEVIILGVQGTQVKLGIKAPPDVSVHREEIYRSINNIPQSKEDAQWKNFYAFLYFWNLYPKKSKKEEAKQIWMESCSNEYLEPIRHHLKSINYYNNVESIPSAASYLTSKAWENNHVHGN